MKKVRIPKNGQELKNCLLNSKRDIFHDFSIEELNNYRKELQGGFENLFLDLKMIYKEIKILDWEYERRGCEQEIGEK